MSLVIIYLIYQNESHIISANNIYVFIFSKQHIVNGNQQQHLQNQKQPNNIRTCFIMLYVYIKMYKK